MIRILLMAIMLIGSALAHAAPVILVFGDSLSAAYGIRQQDGWVALLQQRLRQQSFDYNVVNASISGETSSGGAARIAAAVATQKPAITIVAHGANDGLRGLPVKQMIDNLTTIVHTAHESGSQILLIGMRMPPNYGAAYTDEYEKAFIKVARKFKSAHLPFLLEGVAGRRELFLEDNLHPTAAAQPMVLETVWKGLMPLLAKR